MEYLCLGFILINSLFIIKSDVTNNIDSKCIIMCPPGDDDMKCGFDPDLKNYTIFANKCALESSIECHHKDFVETPMIFCIKNLLKPIRRFYGDSCPAFCPSHYRPVCGASKMRSYKYRSFNNGCYFDMLNCRGDEDAGYVEVPLHFCQRHAMKNIFKEQVIVSRFNDYKDYNE